MAEIHLYHHPRHAVLGDQPLQITDPGPSPITPIETWPPAPILVGVSPHNEILERLDRMTAEIIGLRADLAARTLAARLRRGWRWLCVWAATLRLRR